MRQKIDYGIDLGTTNSAIARMEDGEAFIIKSDNTQTSNNTNKTIDNLLIPTTEDGKKASSQNARSNFANLACAELNQLMKKQVKLLKKLSNLDFEQDLQDIENEITGIKKILGSGTTRKSLKQTNK